MMIDEYFSKFFNGTKDPSLKAMRYFMKMNERIDKDIKFIHVAGTNGKGSCVETLNNILVQAGYKVGKYISPYLVKYNEIMSINNKDISDEEFISLINEMDPYFEEYMQKYGVNLTWFEVKTILALWYFYQENVDIVILETGLGGRYDCTNVISKPIVSIITSIGYDHMNILGNTLLEIAQEKAGIIKEESETVFFSQEEDVNDLIKRTCQERKNTLHILDEDKILNYHYDMNYQYFDFENYHDIKINLKGKVQVKNALLCIKTIDILKRNGFLIDDKSLYKGLSTVVHHGRMEVLSNRPLIIYDGAHNEPAIKNLQDNIKMYYQDYKKIYVISILKRKDYSKILELLLRDSSGLFIFTSGNDLNEFNTKETLYEEALKFGKEENLKMLELDDAIEFIKKEYGYASFIVGSFYIYGDVLRLLK